MKTTRVLLTGASGTIGQNVIAQLAEDSRYQLTVFDLESRGAAAAFAPYQDRIRIVYGDISKFDQVEKACRDQDTVIHLAAIIPPLADEKPDLAQKVNVIGTHNLIRALEKHSPQAFVLFSSSISVYGDRVETPQIRVSDAIRPSAGDFYAQTKIEAEKALRESRLHWSIFRLAAVMGVSNHKLSSLMFHMPLNTSLEMITPEDSARAFVHALGRLEILQGRTFNLGGGELCRTSYKDFLNRSFKAFGLGSMLFPEGAFAERNFHCGYYADGDELEDLLSFRKQTLSGYYAQVDASVPAFKRVLARIFNLFVQGYLLLLSEPFRVKWFGSRKQKERFFRLLPGV